MELIAIEEDGVRVLEGQPEQPFLSSVKDMNRIIEACYPADTNLVLLYAPNLTSAFFDLSSGEAGEILQKVQTYHMRLAIVCPPDSVQYSSRFGEMLSETRQSRYFKVFETRREARAWLDRVA